MFALVYSSVATGNPGSFDALLATCRRNNEQMGVTGCLLFVYDESDGPDYFAQFLEGDQPAVEAVYARIAQDSRHRDVRLLSSGPAPGRRFTDSPMRLAELPSTRILAAARPRGLSVASPSVESIMRDSRRLTSLVASYGDDA